MGGGPSGWVSGAAWAGVAIALVAGCSNPATSGSASPGASSGVEKPGKQGKTHTLVFEITGDAELATLTYTVDGKRTAEKAVDLPWRKSISLPPRKGGHTWVLKTKHDGEGESAIKVFVDGRPLTQSACAGSGCTGSADGSIAE